MKNKNHKVGKYAPSVEQRSPYPLTVFRLLLGVLLITFTVSGFGASLQSQEEKNFKDSSGMNMESILGDVRSIWPSGKCADNISGEKEFILFAFACKADFTADNRKAFLDKMIARGWQLRREDYHIDKNSASYFYKFQVDLDHDIYFKLFFRDPVVIWPLHENNRPKIVIILNDVQKTEDIQKWMELKLPFTVSVSMLSDQRDNVIEAARKLSYDTWLFIPDSVEFKDPNEKSINESKNNSQEDTEKETQNPVVSQSSENLETLTEILSKKQDQYFPYSGITISSTNLHIKNIERLRTLFKIMKKEGLKKFVGPSSPEIIDTSKVLDIYSPANTYYLGLGKTINETAWQNAYENAKNNGYSVIILDARNNDARNFLLQMIQQTISFIDYTNLEHVY